MVEGLNSLKRKLNKTIPDAVREAAKKALEQSARELVAEMQRLVPVDSGALRDSIGWTWGDAPAGATVVGTVAGSKNDTMRITIYAGGDGAFYARFQEFGTVKMPPSPFFYPSYRKLKRKIKGRNTRAINKAIKSL